MPPQLTPSRNHHVPPVHHKLWHHQCLSMVHVDQRLLLGGIILPVTVVLVPIAVRIVYQILTLCVIGLSTTTTSSEGDHDVWVMTAVAITVGLYHVGTTQFLRVKSYLQSWSTTRHYMEEPKCSSSSSSSSSDSNQMIVNYHNNNHNSDDDDHSSKENSQTTDATVRDKPMSASPSTGGTTGNLPTGSASNNTTPLQERHDHNTSDTGAHPPPIPTHTNDHTTPPNDPSCAPPVPAPPFTRNPQKIPNHTTTTTVAAMSNVYIFIGAFLFTCVLLRYIRTRNWSDHHVIDASRRLSRRHSHLPDYLLPSFITTIRCAICMLVYSLMIALRFLGPTSIMRLSIFPLVPNPWDRTIKNLLYVLRDTLIHHSYPTVSDKQQQQQQGTPKLIVHHQQSLKYDIVPASDEKILVGRRYERPTMYATMQHIVISLMAGITVAYIGILPYTTTTTNHHSDDIQLYTQSIHMASCIFTAFGSLITILDGASHEINPYLYTNQHKTAWFQEIYSKIVSRVFYATTIVPIVSMITAAYMMRWDVGVSFKIYLQCYVLLLRNCAGMSLYLYAYDEMTRTSLFFPRPNVSKLIRQWSDDTSSSTATQLGIILNSLLGDPSLVQQVVNVSYTMTRVGTNSFEKEELLALETHSKQMAHVLLSPIYNNALSEAQLEDDVFRIVLLEAFGGGGTVDRRQLFTVSERHQRLISEWIDRPIPRYQSSKVMGKPLSSALVRGLCVFIGGSGSAFTILSSLMSSRPVGQQRQCTLSLSVFCSLELCVTAIGRCITRSLTSSSGQILSDWKCSHLSIQIPSALVAIFKLRCGVVQYSKIVHQDYTNHRRDVSGSTSMGAYLVKEYGRVVRICDSVASLILRSMKSLQGLGRIDHTLLDNECQEWKDHLIDQFAENDSRK